MTFEEGIKVPLEERIKSIAVHDLRLTLMAIRQSKQKDEDELAEIESEFGETTDWS